MKALLIPQGKREGLEVVLKACANQESGRHLGKENERSSVYTSD